MTLLLSAAASAAAPWILQPSFAVSAEYQTNPSYDVTTERSGHTETISLTLPIASQSGPNKFDLSANALLRSAHGALSSDTNGYDVQGAWVRFGERFSTTVKAGSARSSLLGASRVDLGVSRAAGYEINNSAQLVLSWPMGERDSLNANASFEQQRFDTPSGSDFVEGDFGRAGLSYSRTLTGQLQLLFSASAGRSESDERARRSRDFGAQAGFAYQLDEVWTFRISGGQSSVRNSNSGATSSGATYDLTISRDALRGPLSFKASRGLQASAFGTVVQQEDIALSYGRQLSERLTLRADVGWSSLRDTFIGFDLSRRELRSTNLVFSYAMSPVMTLSVQAGYTRSINPASLFRTASSAESMGGSIAMTRNFGPVGLLCGHC